MGSVRILNTPPSESKKKKTMNRTITNTIILGLSIFILWGCNQQDPKRKIGYIQITEDPVLNLAKKGLFQAFADSGFTDGENIRIIDHNANGDLSLIISILQSFQSQGVELIITNSTPCMVSAAQIITHIPIVFTVSFGPEQVGLKTTPDNLYGYYDPFDTDGFISMMLQCVPELKKVGMPYNNAEPNSEYSANALSRVLNTLGIEVVTTPVNSANDILIAGQYLAAQQVDAIVVAADNTVYNGLNALANVASQEKIPLFVTDAYQSQKGAAIGMGVNYERWGYLSGIKAIKLLKNQPVQPKIEPIQEIEVYINQEACKKQNVTVPPELREMDRKSIVIQ